MNIHVPQSIQTVTELRLIANAAEHFVTPSTSRIVINAKQDTLLGSYVCTYDTTRIDWKDCMNIIMTTSKGIDINIPKNKILSGKYLYSLIIPKGINIVRKNEAGDFSMKIQNGLIKAGIFGKSEIGTILQKSWFQYGTKVTQNFIDDLQHTILQFLMIRGYSLGIKDTIVPKEVNIAVKKFIETKRKEALGTITVYENDTYAMTLEAFEINLQATLQASQSEIQKEVMENLNTDNALHIAIRSGGSGTDMNAGQIIASIGQVIVEGRRIQKRFNNRTLPTFHQFDDSAFARGYCANSFLSGLNPMEFFFGVMGGREGLINTAIGTADSGYVQRKLIKILEDIKVEYDGTVRNANDKLIQCVYGDNGINTEKQIDQKIILMRADNNEIREKYVYTKQELTDLKKNGNGNGNGKYTMELNETLYKKLINMRNHLRQIQRRFNTSPMAFKESYMMPVDINQFITNIINREDRDNSDIVDPYYVLSKIKSMYSGAYSKILKYNDVKSVIKKADEQRVKLLFKFYLFDYLAPKKCTHVHKFSTGEFDEILEYFRLTVLLAKVEGGEMVGFVGAQSIGEPVTQTNLKSFHKSGTGKTVSSGLARVKELTSVTKKIKTPVTKIIINDMYKTDKVIVNKIASYLKHTTLGDVVDMANIIYDPNPFDKKSYMSRDGVTNIFEGGQGKSGCQSEINNLPWILRLVLSKEKMIERNVTMLEIKTSFCKNWVMRYEDSKGAKKEYKKIIEKISHTAVISNFDNSETPIVHIRFDANNYNFNTLIQFLEMVINKYKIKGIANIIESNNVVEETYVDFDEDGKVVNKKNFVIVTEGINLADISQINGINLEETFCNDIVTIYETYGVEAARTAFIREFTLAIENTGGMSNYQHIELLADAVTHMGGLIAVNRHGANKLDTDPFSRASFEKTVEQLLAAAAFGESDHIRSVSARIMIGSMINGGTGCFDLLLDHMKVKRTLAPKTEIVQTSIVKKNTAVSDLIKKKRAK